jgi:hypothetical protein
VRIPEKHVCDLCRVELTKPSVRMVYPLDAEDLKLLEAQLPRPNVYSPLSLLLNVTPTGWTFDFCCGCAEGFMPMLADLKTQAITTWLAERARRAEAPIGDNDD